MSRKTQSSEERSISVSGWTVTFSALGINLALGVLYSWSVISKGIPASWGWGEADKSWPYSIACLVFSIFMVLGGRLQDKIGPRITATIGGLLVGVGLIIASLTTSLIGFMVGFGVLAGAGIGFGYASATPPAVKWFPSAKTGLITGIVVSGFGLASVYVAPLAQWLIGTQGLQKTILILGIAFFIMVVGLAQFLRVPHKVLQFSKRLGPAEVFKPKITRHDDVSPKDMLKTSQFYILWFMYACGAGAGLMIISKLAAIAKQQVGINLGFMLVAVLAIGNGAGRIIAGSVSDKMGRQKTMLICFVCQAIMVFLLSRSTTGTFLGSVPVLALISALIGANYGANLSLFPSIVKDYYGLKNFGVNYGLVFTAWGMGGFMLALGAGRLYDLYHSYNFAYYGASVLLVLAAATTFALRAPAAAKQPAAEAAMINPAEEVSTVLPA
ncbi:MAG: OFA family MFS transporter [Chitinivibrionales bacterium]|nr:OFA family MFS transporter [Chitinivibrionales bacterium]